jgi:hypothetical protein
VTVLAASGRGRSVFVRNVANQVGAFDSAANVSYVIPPTSKLAIKRGKTAKNQRGSRK